MNNDIANSDLKEMDPELKEQLKQITIARVKTISNEARISLGSEDYSSEELIKHIEKDDEIGEELIRMNWQYLKDLASGAIYGE
jgi:hypothetical protein